MLLPLTLGVMFSLLQWSLVSWAQSTAQAAAHHGATVTAGLGATEAAGRSAAVEAAGNGSLTAVDAQASRGRRDTVVTVSGRAVAIIWPFDVSATAHVATERLSGS